MLKGDQIILPHNLLKNLTKNIALVLTFAMLCPADCQAAPSTPAVDKESSHRKVILVLAGGGAKGLAHIGVLKVLEEEGIRPDFISGTSVGALIGSLSAANLSSSEIRAAVLNDGLQKAFFPRPALLQEVVYLPRFFLLRLLQLKPIFGLYSGKSIAKFMTVHLPKNCTEIEQLPIAFTAICVDLKTGKKVLLNRGDIAKAVEASCSVPFLYRPVKDEEQYLVDGGISSNLATTSASKTGAIVIAVRLHGYTQHTNRSSIDTSLKYAGRVTSILMASVEEKSLPAADLIIDPRVEEFDLDSFNQEDMLRAIEAGEIATRAVLPELRHLLEYNQALPK